MARETKGSGTPSPQGMAETLLRLRDHFEPKTEAAGSGVSEAVIQGSVVRAEYVERTMRFWLITKPEIETLSMMNGLANVSFSLCGFFLSGAIGFLGNYELSNTITDTDRFLAYWGGGSAFIIAACCFGVGIWAMIKKSNTMRDMKLESRVIVIPRI
jgi:hypothetical protein